MAEPSPPARNQQHQAEVSVLEKFALRWSVLAAWYEQLVNLKLALPAHARDKLEEARIKLSSGCYSSCEVGCTLAEVEADLVSSDGSSSGGNVDFWLDLLGLTMSETVEVERLLRVSAVKIQYQSCGFARCKCGG